MFNHFIKREKKQYATNYRAISIGSTIGKIFDRIISSYLTESIGWKICQQQHGFINGKSTITNLMEFNQYTSETIANNQRLDIIYLDFEKAFDSISHTIIIKKMQTMGFSKKALIFFTSFLTQRTIYIKINESKSYCFVPTSGVPQGNPISSIIFSIFINDLPAVIKNAEILLYADDAKIFKAIKCDNDIITLQTAINALETWCDINKMKLNIGKSKLMSITRSKKPLTSTYYYKGHQFERVNYFNDLGVIIDNKLNFKLHIDSIICKANTVLGFIRRLCPGIFGSNTIRQLYSMLVRPILEYGCVLWNPCAAIHQQRIESIQKQFLIFALRHTEQRDENFRFKPYIERLSQLNLETLVRRRINFRIIFIYDVLIHKLKTNIIHELQIVENNRNLRSSDFVKLFNSKLYYGINNPMVDCVRLFNIISKEFAITSNRNEFIKNLKNIHNDKLI